MRWLSLLLCVALVAAVARAQDPAGDPWDLEVMRGLRALHVVVRPVSAAAQQAGLHHDTLRADIEHRLRREGLALVVQPPAPTDAPEPGWATLRLNVDDLRKDSDPTGYHDFWLSLDLVQSAELAGRPNVRAQVATWSTGAAGSHRAAELPDTVREALRLALDAFIRDYRAMNEERAAPIAADVAEVPEPEDAAEANPEGD